MTNLFPYESISGDHPVQKRILRAQVNYEFRDLQLSVWAKLHPKDVYRKADNKRVIFFGGAEYPFKQSAPYRLVDMVIELMSKGNYFDIGLNNQRILNCVNGDRFVVRYLGGLQNYISDTVEMREGIDKFYLFFCSQKYTTETGIEPQIVSSHAECVEMYDAYVAWKIRQAEI